MSTADAAKKATALEPKLKSKAFLGGAAPNDEDKKAFTDLLGDGNDGLQAWVGRMGTKAIVTKKAAEIEGTLKGKPFLGGNTPSAEDVKAFQELLGGGNTALYRWVRNIASYTGEQRKAFGAPAKGKTTTYSLPAGKEAAAPKAVQEVKAAPKAEPAPKAAPAADSDDEDLFGETTPEQQAALDKRKADIAMAMAKKAKQPEIIAKSNIVLDIKPWDDTTDLEALNLKLRAIEKDGLLWGAYRLTPIAFGIKKLSIMIVIEDDKISSDDLEDMIMAFDEEVQSMDVASWVKV